MSRHIHAPAYSANVQRCKADIARGTYDPFGGKEHIAADKLLDVVTAPDPVALRIAQDDAGDGMQGERFE